MSLGLEAHQALRADGRLAEFNRGRVLSAADVQVARRLGTICGEAGDDVLLAMALLVRATRHGSVVLDLSTAESTTSRDLDEDEDGSDLVPLDWPVVDGWIAACAASPVLDGPVRMVGSRLWLRRYWDQEAEVADQLVRRSADRPDDLDLGVLRAGIDRIFGTEDSADQRAAVGVCALSRVSILVGGPGTGKTTTVSRLLALLKEQHPEWRVALAAPTGKAAARLEEAVRTSAAERLTQVDRDRVGDLAATTLHRLLGWRPDARSRFRHDRDNRLPFEVVVVDESSMLSLTLMARLLEALRPSTRLVLVGDPDQLASVEAGAVLGDLVDRGRMGHRSPDFARDLLAVVPAAHVIDSSVAPLDDGVSALSINRRFGPDSTIGRLAAAVQDGRTDDAVALLRSGAAGLDFVEVAEDSLPTPEQLTDVVAAVRAAGQARFEAADRGEARGAVAALDRHRILCAHRAGPRGVRHWGDLAALWSTEGRDLDRRADGHYAGEPLLVTSNDYDVGLYNGDTGVIVREGDGGLVAAFGRGGAPIRVPVVRLGAVEAMHAMTVHRSQGSQFAQVTVVLPPVGSRLLTRQTLYTAITRAESLVRLVGSEAAFRAAVDTPAARATGLRERLADPATR